jgi:hypothetical protein
VLAHGLSLAERVAHDKKMAVAEGVAVAEAVAFAEHQRGLLSGLPLQQAGRTRCQK